MNILLADPQPNIRYGLKLLLTEQSGILTVGEVIEARDLLIQIEATNPDLLLVSWEFVAVEGQDSLVAIKQRFPNLSIIVMCARMEYCKQGILAGADAFISQAESPQKLLAVIQKFQDCIRQ